MRSLLGLIAATAALGGTLLSAPAPVPSTPSLPGPPAAMPPRDNSLLVRGPTYVYDHAYDGARTTVAAYRSRQDRATVVFVVTGMPRSTWGRRFGVHVHTNRCGRDPAAAGPHFANPRAPRGATLAEREIWLDVRVLVGGFGISRHTTTYPLPRGIQANSVVLHAQPTNQVTGEAGARVMCTTVPLGNIPSGATR